MKKLVLLSVCLFSALLSFAQEGKSNTITASNGWEDKDNVMFVAPFNATAGTQATISIEMKNKAEIRGFQFNLYLPEGITVVKSSKRRIQGALSPGRLPAEDEHTLTLSEHPADVTGFGSYIKFLCSSQYMETFTGNSGEVATLQVNVASDMAKGTYPIQLREIRMTENDIRNYYDTALIESTVTIEGASSGIVSIDNGPLTIDNEAGAWYTLDGRKLAGKPAQKGVYIHNGKKVAMK